jgi:hypothetical protein
MDVKVQLVLTLIPTLTCSLMSPARLLGVFAVIFTLAPVGPIVTPALA